MWWTTRTARYRFPVIPGLRPAGYRLPAPPYPALAAARARSFWHNNWASFPGNFTFTLRIWNGSTFQNVTFEFENDANPANPANTAIDLQGITGEENVTQVIVNAIRGFLQVDHFAPSRDFVVHQAATGREGNTIITMDVNHSGALLVNGATASEDYSNFAVWFFGGTSYNVPMLIGKIRAVAPDSEYQQPIGDNPVG